VHLDLVPRRHDLHVNRPKQQVEVILTGGLNPSPNSQQRHRQLPSNPRDIDARHHLDGFCGAPLGFKRSAPLRQRLRLRREHVLGQFSAGEEVHQTPLARLDLLQLTQYLRQALVDYRFGSSRATRLIEKPLGRSEQV